MNNQKDNLEDKNIYRRGAEAQRKTIFHFLSPMAKKTCIPLRLCASAVNHY